MLKAISLVGIIGLLLCFAISVLLSDIVFLIVGVILFVICLYKVIEKLRKRLEVKGEKISYTSSFGSTKDFTFYDISEIYFKTLSNPPEAQALDRNGNVLFKVDNSMVNFKNFYKDVMARDMQKSADQPLDDAIDE